MYRIQFQTYSMQTRPSQKFYNLWSEDLNYNYPYITTSNRKQKHQYCWQLSPSNLYNPRPPLLTQLIARHSQSITK